MSNITGKKDYLSQSVIENINKCADESKNPNIVITSTLRLPKDQAKAMAENLYNGKRIGYAWAGQQVVSIFDENSKKKSRSEIEKLMEAKIIQLSILNSKVSSHCVTIDQYNKCNIIDISCKKENLPNPRDFVKELIKNEKIVKVITPFTDISYNDSRVIKDKSETCIHIEMNV